MARDIKIRITGDSSGLKSAFGDAEGFAQGFGSRVTSILGGAAKAAAIGLGGGLAATVPILKDAIGRATDFNETVSKTGVIFGDSANQIIAWADDAAQNMGQTRQEAMDAAATFATFGKSAGLSGQDLVKFSKKLTGLASDMASFNNTSPEEAIEAIGAALRGEAEPIRQFGVLLDDATLRNEALKLGLISTTKEALTPANKVLAAQSAILAQTTAAQGDFERTSDGLANKQRILAAEFKDLSQELGGVFLPIALQVGDFLMTRVVPAFREVNRWIQGVAATARESGWAAAFREVVDQVAEVIGSLATRAWDFLSPRLPEWLASFGQWFTNTAAPWMGDRAADLGGKIAELSRFAWDKLKENLPAWLEAFGKWFTETAVPWVVEKVESIASAVAGWVPQAWDKTVEKLKEYLKKLETWFENDGKAGGEAGGQSVTEGVIRGLGQLWLATQTVLAEWQAKVTHWFLTVGAPAVGKGMAELWLQAMQTMSAAAQNLTKAAFNIGQDIVEGFIDGILDMVDDLERTITRFIWAPVNAAKKLLGISSPSKVFAEIGGQIAQGLIVGLDAAGSQVAAASNRLADATMVGFGGIGLTPPAPAGMFTRGPAKADISRYDRWPITPLGLGGDSGGGALTLSGGGYGGGGAVTININGVVGERDAVLRWVAEGLRRAGFSVSGAVA